jgi:CDP-paratose 2-epimerase
MRIFITGICGFAGSSLARQLRELIPGAKISGMDSLSRPGSEINRRMAAEGIAVRHGDMRCASDLETLPDVDWVIDAAAQPSVLAGIDGRFSSRQLVEHNLLGTVNLLEFCRRSGAGFILLSTSRVYSIAALVSLPLERKGNRFVPDVLEGKLPGCTGQGVEETFSTAAPVSLYGSTKVASECLALEYGAAFSFPVWINRCGVLAGAGQFGTAEQGIFSYWLHAWKRKRALRYIGFGGLGLQVRDALHPSDLARLLTLQMQSPAAGAPKVLHASGGVDNSMSLAELSEWCAARFGPHAVGADEALRAFDIPWLILNSGAAEKAWNWRPRLGMHDILEEIARHAEAHPDWLDLAGG